MRNYTAMKLLLKISFFVVSKIGHFEKYRLKMDDFKSVRSGDHESGRSKIIGLESVP